MFGVWFRHRWLQFVVVNTWKRFVRRRRRQHTFFKRRLTPEALSGVPDLMARALSFLD